MNTTYSYSSSNYILTRISIIFAALVLILGCASTPPPIAQMAVSRAAVGNANNAGANELAPVQIKIAKDKLAAAEAAMTAKNYVLATNLAEQAEVDAILAGALARSIKAQKAAEVVQEDNRVLRNEIDRTAE